jgi:uncharacterized protein YndB with AHSA1/START domain
MIPERIQREIVIEASPERVWAVLTEPEHVGTWFAESVAGDLQPGRASVLTWAEHGSFNVVVEASEPHRYFAYRWAARSPGADPVEGNSTLVEFHLVPEGNGTRLQVVESGFGSLDEEQEEYVRDNTEGWAGALSSLEKYVAETAEATARR